MKLYVQLLLFLSSLSLSLLSFKINKVKPRYNIVHSNINSNINNNPKRNKIRKSASNNKKKMMKSKFTFFEEDSDSNSDNDDNYKTNNNDHNENDRNIVISNDSLDNAFDNLRIDNSNNDNNNSNSNDDEWVTIDKKPKKISSSSSSTTTTISSIISSSSSAKVILLILVGLPGSGKSTLANAFCDDVRKKRRQWKVTCQDVLGSRINVINKAKQYLTEGYSVIIDRCNFDQNQRAHWIKLAKQFNAPTFCLELPNGNDVTFCIDRAESRPDDGYHTLKAEGPTWSQIITFMKNDYVAPSLMEGFVHIFQCRNDNDTQNALKILESL